MKTNQQPNSFSNLCLTLTDFPKIYLDHVPLRQVTGVSAMLIPSACRPGISGIPGYDWQSLSHEPFGANKNYDLMRFVLKHSFLGVINWRKKTPHTGDIDIWGMWCSVFMNEWMLNELLHDWITETLNDYWIMHEWMKLCICICIHTFTGLQSTYCLAYLKDCSIEPHQSLKYMDVWIQVWKELARKQCSNKQPIFPDVLSELFMTVLTTRKAVGVCAYWP